MRANGEQLKERLRTVHRVIVLAVAVGAVAGVVVAAADGVFKFRSWTLTVVMGIVIALAAVVSAIGVGAAWSYQWKLRKAQSSSLRK